MTRQQKLVPIGVLFIMVLAVGWAMVPYNFANVVDCEAPLFGSQPKNEAPPTSFIHAKDDCLAKGKSRLLVSAVAAFIAALAGAAMVAAKPISASCSSGDHDDCREWWLAPLGATAAGFGCQCECHDVVW
ncbi:MAG TPA: hypothetical protein VMZ73_05180 [Acidimicrobiales bacterium]|nr:hypothetical protein [Acidimicrobiales bacterium]